MHIRTIHTMELVRSQDNDGWYWLKFHLDINGKVRVFGSYGDWVRSQLFTTAKQAKAAHDANELEWE